MSDPVKKRGCGCIAKGCVVMIILAGIFMGLGVRGYRKFAAMIRSHTSGTPVEIPAENGTQDEYDALVKKLDAFKNAAPGAGTTLELTGHDLNLLIAFSPEWIVARGRVHATIDKDQVGLAGSLPLGFMPSLEGQYLNAEIYFSLSMDDKLLRVSVQNIKLTGGGELSSDETKRLSNYWAAYLTNSMLPVLGPVLDKAKSLKVKDGSIVLTPE